MNESQDNDDLNQKIEALKSDSDFQLISEMLLAYLLPQILVAYKLDDLFNEDRAAAIKTVRQILTEDKVFDTPFSVRFDLDKSLEQLSNYIYEMSNDFFKDFKFMVLFYGVSLFEQIVNSHLQDELNIGYDFDIRKCNKILHSLTLRDKLSWFLEIICGVNYTEEYDWGKILPLVKTRNYFMHYKPDEEDEFRKNRSKLTKQSVLDFIQAVQNSSVFLREHHSPHVSKVQRREQQVRDNLF